MPIAIVDPTMTGSCNCCNRGYGEPGTREIKFRSGSFTTSVRLCQSCLRELSEALEDEFA